MPKQSIIIDNFLGGLAPSTYFGGANQADPKSVGWDCNLAQDENILRRGYGLSSITNASLVKADITWMKTVNRSAGAYCYLLSKDVDDLVNKLHKITVQEGATTHTVASASPWPHELPTYGAGTGMEIYNGNLFYASGRYLGTYNLSLTFNNSLYTTLGTEALGANIEHPMVQGNGFLYIGNSNFSLNTPSVARYDGAIMQPNYLDLSKIEKVVTDLAFNNKFVYIATTGNVGTTNNRADSALYVWDGVSPSWQEQFAFPDEDFVSIKFANGKLLCWGKRGLYQFTGSSFEMIHSLEGGPGNPWAVDVHPEGQMTYQGTDRGAISMFKYGTFDKRLPSIIQRPLNLNASPLFDGVSGMIWPNKNVLYIGGAGSGDALRRFDINSTTYNEGTWKTPMVTFPERARIVSIKVYFLPLASGATFTVGWAKDAGTTDTDLFTVTGDGSNVSQEYHPAGVVADQLQLVVTHTAGATPKIRRFEIEWEAEKN